MNGINKTVNLQKKVTITTDDLKEVDLAFLTLMCEILPSSKVGDG